MKDWTGNHHSAFVCNGASNHSEQERETNDFYSTDPETLKIFLNALNRDGLNLHNNIWECACGQGHLSKVLEDKGYNVYSTDLIDRGFGEQKDFLKCDESYQGDILTNPPYKFAKEFVEKALELIENGYYCCMLLKIQFLEGKARRKLFEKYPPKYVYINSTRQFCYSNGDMSKKMSSSICYCWHVWEKGFKGEPIIRWI